EPQACVGSGDASTEGPSMSNGSAGASVDAGSEASRETSVEDTGASMVPDASTAPDAAMESSIDGTFDASDADRSEAGPSSPIWRALGQTGLGDMIVGSFDFELSPDGTPFLAITKLMPPGRARSTVVLRYDGAAWQKLGDDLTGTDYALA